jgi:molybdopterin converting factor small subunit
MRVHIPNPLLSYTHQARTVEAAGTTLAALIADLDRQFPGIRFRIVDEQARVRPHIKIFVDSTSVRSLDASLDPASEILLVAALSGG